jgi:hypothetical protein
VSVLMVIGDAAPKWTAYQVDRCVVLGWG